MQVLAMQAHSLEQKRQVQVQRVQVQRVQVLWAQAQARQVSVRPEPEAQRVWPILGRRRWALELVQQLPVRQAQLAPQARQEQVQGLQERVRALRGQSLRGQVSVLQAQAPRVQALQALIEPGLELVHWAQELAQQR
jgi:hypothetical protein